MRSNAPYLLTKFTEFQRRNGAPSHYHHLAITGEMASWPFLKPGADVVGVTHCRHDAERGATKRGVHLGNQLFEGILLRAERAGEIAIEPVRGAAGVAIMPISA